MPRRETRPLAVLIRPATSADGPALTLLRCEIDRLHARLAPAFFAAPTPAEAVLVSDHGGASPGDGLTQTLVAVHDRRVVGAIELELHDTPRQADMVACRRLFVARLMVDRVWRRRGVGRKLMEAADQWAARRRATQVVLTVWDGNRTAERFYRALGYRVISRVMERELP